MIERDGPPSLSRQCALLGVSRSSRYYRPKGESAENLALMRRMDELHMDYPFYGSRQMMRHLRREGVVVGRHRIRRLMRLMGMEATYRRPRTSVASPEHRVFPYLLRGLAISRADHVWCADITYVPVTQGFFYLVAVMDWATRHVLAWRLSNTMDASFCVDALDDALGRRAPEILNTDQGAQFTSEAFAERVLGADVAFSMDGRGRFLDNIFIERLWRSLKYEAVYLHELRNGPDAERIIGSWFDFYNEVRPHSSLGGRTPGEAYRNGTGGGVNGGSPHLPERALPSRRGRAETRDPPVPDASRHRRPSPGHRPGSPPGHRPGSPPGHRGPCWNLSFPRRGRTRGWSIHPKTTHGECSRGLSQSLGIHLNFALGLSNEIGPPQLAMAVGRMPGERQEELFIAASAVGALDWTYPGGLNR